MAEPVCVRGTCAAVSGQWSGVWLWDDRCDWSVLLVLDVKTPFLWFLVM